MCQRWGKKKKRCTHSPKALILSDVNAGTIFENMRHGRVMLSRIWPAPAAATAGKMSALVIAMPHDTQNILERENCTALDGYGKRPSPSRKRARLYSTLTYRRSKGRHDIQMSVPAPTISSLLTLCRLNGWMDGWMLVVNVNASRWWRFELESHSTDWSSKWGPRKIES